MPKLRDPLFLGVNFLNIRAKDKKEPTISVRLNLQRDDLIYATSIKSRMEVVGYEDELTDLFVTHIDGVDTNSVYHRFRLEAVKFAKAEYQKFMNDLQAYSAEDYDKLNYKPRDYIMNSLSKCLVDRQELYADLQKQVNLIASRKLPRVNEFLFFADDESPLSPVTARIPYNNPAGVTLTDEQRALVDMYLDTFFDAYNKKVFAWYMGAALCNIPIYDDRVSKLAIVSSSHGGSGKSTLVNTMVDALFTPHYREIKDEFDSFFFNNNKFGVSSLSYKRMSVYSEAKFNNDPTSKEHNFAGMNVSVIKSLITEGYVSSEAKFGDREMERLTGFHMVLTNHPPVITEENEAMNRRILAIMIRPTKMTAKARTLKLWGKQKLEDFVKKNAELFAAYFVQTFMSDEYMFADVDYDHNDYTLDIADAQEEQDDTSRENINVLKTYGLVRAAEQIGQEMGLDVSPFVQDIIACVHSEVPEALTEHLRYEDDILYLDSSKEFLLRYGNYGIELRRKLKDMYGAPIKKFHKRVFTIPFPKQEDEAV